MAEDISCWLERRLLEQRRTLENEHRLLVADLRWTLSQSMIPYKAAVEASEKSATLEIACPWQRGESSRPMPFLEQDQSGGEQSKRGSVTTHTQSAGGTSVVRTSVRPSMDLYVPPPEDLQPSGSSDRLKYSGSGLRKTVSEKVAAMKRGGTFTNSNPDTRWSGLRGRNDKKTLLQRIVSHVYFDLGAGAAIIANTILLAVETHMQTMQVAADFGEDVYGYAAPHDEHWTSAEDIVRRMDIFLTVIFIMELVLRISADRLRACASGWIWFDAIIVSFGTLELMDVGELNFNATLLRCARLARMMRVLRIIRLIRYFDSLYLLIKSIQASVGALVWSFVCLLSVQAAVGLGITQLLYPFMTDENIDYERRILVYGYFGTLLRMMVTMFEITIGNWVPSCRDLMDNVSDWFGLFYILYTCCLMFAVVRVITAVFITETQRVVSNDDAIAVRQKEKERKAYLQRLKLMFKELDASGDGYVSYDEFEEAFKLPVMQTWLSTLDVNVHELEHLFKLLDTGSGEIEIDEFIQGVSRLKGSASSIDVVTILKTVNALEGKLDKALANLPGEIARSWGLSKHGHGHVDIHSAANSGCRSWVSRKINLSPEDGHLDPIRDVAAEWRFEKLHEGGNGEETSDDISHV